MKENLDVIKVKKVAVGHAVHGRSNELKLTIKQVSSAAGSTKKQLATLKGLSLSKIGKISQLNDTIAIRGMIAKVSHLVCVVDSKKQCF